MLLPSCYTSPRSRLTAWHSTRNPADLRGNRGKPRPRRSGAGFCYYTLHTSPFPTITSLPPLPGKLVGKIQGLQYVEAKEFMPDNIKLIKRLESMDRPSLATIPPSLLPNLREVPSLLTWVLCFAQYIVVLSEYTLISCIPA